MTKETVTLIENKIGLWDENIHVNRGEVVLFEFPRDKKFKVIFDKDRTPFSGYVFTSEDPLTGPVLNSADGAYNYTVVEGKEERPGPGPIYVP